MPYHGRVDFYVDGGLAGWQDNIDYRIHTAKEWMLRLPEGDHVVYAQYQGYHGSDGIFIAGSSSAIRIHVVKPAYGSVNFTGTYLYPFGENSSPKSTAIVNVSGDGRLDAVATTGTHTGDAEDFQLYTFLQQSQPDQTLTWGTIWSSHGAWRSAMRIATGDVDGDGESDIGVTAYGGIDLYRQSSGGLTQPLFVSTVGGSGDLKNWADLRIADMDDNGHADLVVAGWEHLMVYPGLGGGEFGAPIPVVSAPRYVEVGDVDADGDPDIVAWDDQDIYLYTRTQTNRYELLSRYTLPLEVGHKAYAVAVGDVTADGRRT